jgi:predicted alpha/beta superfamily hydrolase
LGRLVEIPDFRSAFVEAGRQITVYLPPGYDGGDRRYPVMYWHDGQNLFDGGRSYVPGQIWHAAETATHLIQNGLIEPLILVGVDHGGPLRIDELTPTKDLRSRRGGGAKAYGRMLTEELKPRIDREFRTRWQAADTGLGGSSLGGLATLYLGFRLPQVFGRLAVMSPSLWWDNRNLLSRIRMNRHAGRARIWLDMGTREGRAYVQNLKNTRQLRDLLVARGWREGESLCYVEDPGATHSEHAWAHRLPEVLKFLYPAGGAAAVEAASGSEGDDGIW